MYNYDIMNFYVVMSVYMITDSYELFIDKSVIHSGHIRSK